MRMCYVVIVASPALLYFLTLSRKRRDFRKNITRYKTCVSIFSTTLSESFLILRRNERGMPENIYWPSCKVPVIVRF